MPRFEFDPSKASAGFVILEKNDYEFIIGEPKAFLRTNTDGGTSYGVRYPIIVAEGPHKDKKQIFTCYQHSQGGQDMSKRFLMAALGYTGSQEDEKRFDNDMAGLDWGFDTDSGACGDMWRQLTGKHVMGSLDQSPNPRNADEMQQQYKAWYPYGTTK